MTTSFLSLMLIQDKSIFRFKLDAAADKKIETNGSFSRERAVSEVERLKSVRKERKDHQSSFPMLQFEQIIQTPQIKSSPFTFPENDIEIEIIDRPQRVVNSKVTVTSQKMNSKFKLKESELVKNYDNWLKFVVHEFVQPLTVIKYNNKQFDGRALFPSVEDVNGNYFLVFSLIFQNFPNSITFAMSRLLTTKPLLPVLSNSKRTCQTHFHK